MNTDKCNEKAAEDLFGERPIEMSEKDCEEALRNNVAPPPEFVALVVEGKILIPRKYEEEMEARGWLPCRCEVWSRVMGYYRPVGQWNVGKKQEHAERIHAKEKDFFK